MSLAAAILAGGLGTRLRPFTDAKPKSLVPVLGEPFVFHQMRLLAAHSITHVVMLVGHHGQQIVDAVGDGQQFGVRVDYVFDGKILLGTGGAVARAVPKLGPQFFVLYGDSYLECDYVAIERAFRSAGKSALMTVYENKNFWDQSNVEFRDGRIVAYSKIARTPRMRHIDYGVGLFVAEVFKGVAADAPTDLAEIYQSLLEKDDLVAFEVTNRFYEVGSSQGIEDLEAHLRAGGSGSSSDRPFVGH